MIFSYFLLFIFFFDIIEQKLNQFFCTKINDRLFYAKKRAATLL